MKIKEKIKTIIKKNTLTYKFTVNSRKFIKKHRDGLEFVSYSLYKFFCSIFYKNKNEIISEKQIREFHKRNILVLDSLVPAKNIKQMTKSLESNFLNMKITKKHLKKNTLPKKPFLKFIRYIHDRYIKNIVYYYNYPNHYLDQVNQIIDPLNNIDGFKDLLNKKFIPVLNELMNSKSEIYRAWVYKTININRRETPNQQNYLHKDGDIWTAIKCIIYLCDVDENNGPFAFQDIDGTEKKVLGKKGTAIFFKSASLRHRGSNTINKERLAASFTSYPSLKNKIAEHELRPDFIRKTVPFLPSSNDAYLNDI